MPVSGRRAAIWTVVVFACALPILVFMWRDAAAPLAAQLLGIAVWIVIMIALDTWLLRHERTRASRALHRGALTYAAAEGISSLVSPLALAFVHIPLIGMVRVIPHVVLVKSRFVATVALTLSCGLSALAGVILLAGLWFFFSRRPADGVPTEG